MLAGSACDGLDGGGGTGTPAEVLTPRPTRVEGTTRVPPSPSEASPTARPIDETPTETPSPTSTAVAKPACEQGKADREEHYAQAVDEIETAMEGYQGTWGLAVIDLDCAVTISINPEYVQYTASAGKIVPVIAALKKVQDRTLDFTLIEEHLNEILHNSLDSSADFVNSQVTQAEIDEVLQTAGVSDLTEFRGTWRYAFMPARDLAKVWESLLRGKQLNNRWTKYLLGKAAEVDLPPEYATFPDPEDLGRDGYEYGQKAGYYVSDGVPYFMLGAGYLRPADGSSLGFAMVFEMRTTNPELFDPQRRSVFPIILKYILDS